MAGKIIEVDFKKKQKILSFEQSARQQTLWSLKEKFAHDLVEIHKVTKSLTYTHTIRDLFTDLLDEMQRMLDASNNSKKR